MGKFTAAPVAWSDEMESSKDDDCNNMYPVHSPRREALEMWKQRKGHNATYNNLIAVFESAGYGKYADTVRSLYGE